MVVLRLGCASLRSSLAFSGPSDLFLVSDVWGWVIQSLTLLFFQIAFLSSLAWEVLRLSVSSIKANRSMLSAVFIFAFLGLGNIMSFRT